MMKSFRIVSVDVKSDKSSVESFAHLSADEFAELVVGFNEDGQPIARDADAFRVLWHI